MTQENRQKVTIDGTEYEVMVTEKEDGMIAIKLYNRAEMGSSMVTVGHDGKVRISSYNPVRIIDDTVVERA